MHENGMAHRDLKLENFFVNKEVIIKIADFGTYKYFSGDKASPLTSCVGTPVYAPPEVENNPDRKPYKGPPMDVFALGVILHIMITGNWPFAKSGDEHHKQFLADPGATLVERELEVEPDAIELLHMMLSMEPEERPTV